MIIDLFFIGTFILALSGLVCLHKIRESISLFKSMVLCFITELCIGAVIAQFYSILNLSIDLFSMGFGYAVIGIAIWLLIIKQHKIQRLIIKKVDAYAFLILTAAFVLIFLCVFTVDIKNVYVNSDPAVHFIKAMKVVETKKISSMYFGELYNAIFISLLSPFIERVNYYKAFILADSFANYINLLMFYVLAETVVKSKGMRLLLPFFSILYFLGWPFYSYVLGGFVYFGWGVTLFAYVIYLLLRIYKVNDIRENIRLIFLVVLGSFNVLICYMLFVPFLCLIILYCFNKIRKKNEIDLSRNAKIILGLVGILGAGVVLRIAYLGFFKGDVDYILQALNTDGWIHKDLYRDFVLFVPAYLYMLWKCWREKENNLLVGMTTIIIMLEIVALLACLLDYISPYYYYKAYYLLWVMAWLIFIDAVEYFKIKDKAIAVIYVITLVCPMVMTLSGIDAWLEEKGIDYDETANRHYPGMFPLLDRNEFFLSGEEDQFEDRDALIEACVYIEDYLFGEDIPLITGDGIGSVEWWYKGITQDESVYVVDEQEIAEALEKASEQYSYFLLHENTEIYRQNVKMFQIYDRVYSNGYYGIYKF